MTTWLVRLLLAAGGLLIFTSASGWTPNAYAAGREELFIRKGVELRRQGRDNDALEQFKKAYELGRTARAAAQLGLCEQSVGDWIKAQQHLSEALTAESDPWITQNRAVLQSARDKVEEQLGRVQVSGSPVGAMVSVGGEVAGTLPDVLPIFVMPGRVTISVSATEHEPFREERTARAGESLEVVVSLARHQEAQAPARAPEAVVEMPEETPTISPTPPPSWPGWVAVGSGVALIGVGGYFALAAVKTAQEAREAPVFQESKVSSAQTAGTLRWVFLGTGVVAASVGAALLYRRAQHTSVDVAFLPVFGGGVVSAGGQF